MKKGKNKNKLFHYLLPSPTGEGMIFFSPNKKECSKGVFFKPLSDSERGGQRPG
jgi:hypothetical protein